jgi:hypothetical protein
VNGIESFYAEYIDCPFCEVRNNAHTTLHVGQIGYCVECQTSFNIVGIREGKVLTRIVQNQNIKIQIGGEIQEVSLEALGELLEKGLIVSYINGEGQKGWRITDDVAKVAEALKDEKSK